MAYDIVDAKFVEDNLGKMFLIDVRPARMYEKAHLPGARSVEVSAVKKLGGDVAAEVVRRVKALGVMPDDECIVYCYDGGLAHETCGYLERSGYTKVHCYEGSFSDWVTDPDRPLES